jgi:hypothetical protein
MAVGEALVSCLEADGVPAPVERVRIGKPAGQIGPLSELERKTMVGASAFRTKYPAEIDDHAAHEAFRGRMFADRGLPMPPPRAAPKPIDWNYVFEPLKDARPAPRRRWSVGAKALVAWFVLLGLYGLAAWVFPQV